MDEEEELDRRRREGGPVRGNPLLDQPGVGVPSENMDFREMIVTGSVFMMLERAPRMIVEPVLDSEGRATNELYLWAPPFVEHRYRLTITFDPA